MRRALRAAIGISALQLMLAACSPSSGDAAVEVARKVVLARLDDPNAAKLSIAVVLRKPGSRDTTICGSIESYEFVGFSGPRRFVVRQSEPHPPDMFDVLYVRLEPASRISQELFTKTWNADCGS
jgi:hypothetical protein